MKFLLRKLKPYLISFFLIEFILRCTLLSISAKESDKDIFSIAKIFVNGCFSDIITSVYIISPIILIYLVLPQNIWQRKSSLLIELTIRFIWLFALLFDFVAEILFWEEFFTRFNFIAVDYLVYTHEVIGNIMESYNVYYIITTIAIISFSLAYVSLKAYNNKLLIPTVNFKIPTLICYGLLFSGIFFIKSPDIINFKNDAEGKEIGSNGIYNLFHAFWHNEIHYDRFYAKLDENGIQGRLEALVSDSNQQPTDHFLIRTIDNKKDELRKNVVIIVMESMSAHYMKLFGGKDNLTPNLDQIAEEGLTFTNLYATGTRTIRGLEAISLSIPPTPGQSIVRRPDNDKLFSLGFIFKDRGYDTKFIYGGYGYFDNMNEFFSKNGFSIIDRHNLTKEEVNFSNVWGVADEDIFTRAIKEADQSFAQGKKFLHMIMTTSNHRPFTYPEGKIDISPKSGRLGGVKYADFSVGRLIEQAKSKPWFKDTVFVFVADHTAGAGGKIELDPKKYHIPMIFYAPEFIPPGKHEEMASQIDLAPTLLGLLNFNYKTKLYGRDLLHSRNTPVAFISNYQKLAMLKNGVITILTPKQIIEQYLLENAEKTTVEKNYDLIEDTIAYYQSASWWRSTYRYISSHLGI